MSLGLQSTSLVNKKKAYKSATFFILKYVDSTMQNSQNLQPTIYDWPPGWSQVSVQGMYQTETVEDKWICRLGSFHGSSGLNTRDEIKASPRVNF